MSSVHVSEHHPTGSGTVLLLHAGMSAGWMWREQIAALGEHHLLVPDLPGFGAASGSDWPGAAEVADAVAELIAARAQDGRCEIVGLSLGAQVGLHLLARYPLLVRSALLSGIPARPASTATRLGDALVLALWEQGWFWRLAARFGPFDQREQFLETVRGISRASQRRIFAEDHAAPLPDGLADCPVPVLLLAGHRESQAIAGGLAELAARIPHAQAALVPGAGHLWPVTDPQLCTAVLHEWLAQHHPLPRLQPVR